MSSQFVSLLVVSPLPDGVSWILREPLVYEVGGLGSGVKITVPAGFKTDFASVPRILWVLLPKQGYHTNAAVVHDWLYWDQSLPRWAADQIFLEAMGVSGTLWGVRHVMFRAVRIFGELAWWANAKDKERGADRVVKVLPAATDPVQPRGIEWLVRRVLGMRTHKERKRRA
jgi:hypothetical protein